MCGIFGYLNLLKQQEKSTIIEILLNGLKRLEYRGYDSAGIAIDKSPDSTLTHICKEKGRVSDLQAKIAEEIITDCEFRKHFGIAHTRWATHGEPASRNSHPHFSNEKLDFTLVHNGIITNWMELKKFLENKGYSNFESETDTEVVAKLLQYFYDKADTKPSFAELVTEVTEVVEGAFAFLVKSRHYPNEAIATRRGSPLLVGLTYTKSEKSSNIQNLRRDRAVSSSSVVEDRPVQEYFFSSDLSAIIEHTKKIIFLEDNDMFIVGGNGQPINSGLKEAKLGIIFIEKFKSYRFSQ